MRRDECPTCGNGKDSRAKQCGPCRMLLNPPRLGTGKGWYVGPLGYVIRSRDSRMEYQHRWVMEEALGRRLSAAEVVHHLNGDKTDNRLENLELTTASAHMSDHVTERNQKFNQHVTAANTRWGK